MRWKINFGRCPKVRTAPGAAIAGCRRVPEGRALDKTEGNPLRPASHGGRSLPDAGAMGRISSVHGAGEPARYVKTAITPARVARLITATMPTHQRNQEISDFNSDFSAARSVFVASSPCPL